MAQLVIVADDLTGAADTGACFADAGLITAIRFEDSTVLNSDVVVVSTESRDLDEVAATEAVRSALTATAGNQIDARPRWIYKKIDSALRGHPRDELFAAMEATGVRRALVAPAFPAERRTTVGGRQHIDGVPVESSRIGGAGAVSDQAGAQASQSAAQRQGPRLDGLGPRAQVRPGRWDQRHALRAASGYSRTRRYGSRPRDRDTRFARSAIWCCKRRM